MIFALLFESHLQLFEFEDSTEFIEKNLNLNVLFNILLNSSSRN